MTGVDKMGLEEARQRVAELENKITSDEQREGERCGRCASKIGKTSWEDGWPNWGKISLGCSSQSFAKLRGRTSGCATDEDFEWWRAVKHPVLIDTYAQEVRLEWGSYIRASTWYRLCRKCQNELIALIGGFFEMDKSIVLAEAEPKEKI